MSERDDVLEHEELAPEPFMANMLAAYRDAEDMPSDAKARVQRRLESAPVVSAGDSAAAGSRGLWVGAAVIAVVAAILVVPRLGDDDAPGPADVAESRTDDPIEGASMGGTSPERETSPAPEPAPAPAPEEASDDDLDTVDEPGEAAVEPADEGADRKRSGTARKAHRRSQAAARESGPAPEELSPADSLAAETALLRRAQAALSSGKPRSAFSILREHAQRFPEGVLAEERRALEVVALCDDGQVKRGRKQAKTFLAKHPGSALRERVAAACPEASG